ncbi:MAG: hypothetical protein P8077_04335 [Gammaproteobacteria bacterium]
MLNTLILMGSMLLLGPGCASYRELSPSWREHGTSVLGLVAYDVGFSNAAPVRLSPDTAVMVAFAETPHFGPCRDANDRLAMVFPPGFSCA